VPSFDKASITSGNWEAVATTSMSRMGFAGRPGMEVEPTCSMDWYETPVRNDSSSDFRLANWVAHSGLYGSTMTGIL